LTHDAGNKKIRPAGIAARMAHQPAGIILSGHSHRAVMEVQGAWLFLNPGSAGKKRFKLERTAGLLRLSREIARVEIYSLEGPKPKLYAEGDFPLARA
ncbi:MAG: metallophosphoesterase, partial [Proteobacteria bacterium]